MFDGGRLVNKSPKETRVRLGGVGVGVEGECRSKAGRGGRTEEVGQLMLWTLSCLSNASKDRLRTLLASTFLLVFDGCRISRDKEQKRQFGRAPVRKQVCKVVARRLAKSGW